MAMFAAGGQGPNRNYGQINDYQQDKQNNNDYSGDNNNNSNNDNSDMIRGEVESEDRDMKSTRNLRNRTTEHNHKEKAHLHAASRNGKVDCGG